MTTRSGKRIFIGTAGWAIPRAETAHFPESGSGLARYGSVFNAVEVNSTFRKVHRPATLARWTAAVPDRFRFSVKMPRTITHELKLQRPEEELGRFAAAVHNLGDKMGPWLLQLPPSLNFDAIVARRFFKALRVDFAGKVVCEPRHASWFEPEASDIFCDFSISRVAADPARIPAASEPGGTPDLVYFRLHGSPRMYYSSYDASALTALAHSIERVNSPEIWCIFDNTASGAAAANALALKRFFPR